MSLHLVPASVFLLHELLPDDARPAVVSRTPRVTLLAIDPRTSNVEALAWAVANLYEWESSAFRVAYGGQPVNHPCPDDWMRTDLPVGATPVPECLRPPAVDRREAPTAIHPQRRHEDDPAQGKAV